MAVAVAAGGHVQRGEALLGTPFSIAAELASGDVAVCLVEDLRAMKRAAGRGQDLVDLENLDAAEVGPSGSN
ncbi:MAG TPA: hypothetical protein VF245_11355 [Solirubrobacterales bacterium]